MNILTCDKICLSYGVRDILKEITFSVNEGEKLGIIGINGCGKTTLLRIISGEAEPTSGAIRFPHEVRIGFLKQNVDYDFSGKSVYDYALSAFDELRKAEKELEDIAMSLGKNPDRAELFARKQHDFSIRGGNEYQTKTKSFLARFGFRAESYDFPADQLSGGQKTRLALATLLLEENDVILLDEPTNHLDIDTVEWLENFLRSSQKTFLIVSHDRYFLDRVTTDTLEIENYIAVKYSGSYSQFKEKKKLLQADQQKAYDLQQKEIKRLEAFIENQHRWNRERNIIAAESRQKAIERMVRVEKPKSSPKAVSFSIGSTSGSFDVLSVRHLGKSFTKPLFSDLSFELHKGERMFLIGANGCGKSTLLKVIAGLLPADEGVTEIGYSQTVGYYDQEIQLLDDGNTVVDELLTVRSDLTPGQARTVLASFGFIGEDVFKQVSMLSGGEKARLSIAKLVQKDVSLLMLDEPTNHLDIPSKEVLEQALAAYPGTLLTVSHDRYFINALATRILEIDRNGYQSGYFDFPGSFEQFLSVRVKSTSDDTLPAEKASKEEYLSVKRERSALKTAIRRHDKAGQEIESLEARQKELERLIDENGTDYKKLEDLSAEQNDIRSRLDALYDEYLKLEDEIEQAEKE